MIGQKLYCDLVTLQYVSRKQPGEIQSWSVVCTRKGIYKSALCIKDSFFSDSRMIRESAVKESRFCNSSLQQV